MTAYFSMWGMNASATEAFKAAPYTMVLTLKVPILKNLKCNECFQFNFMECDLFFDGLMQRARNYNRPNYNRDASKSKKENNFCDGYLGWVLVVRKVSLWHLKSTLNLELFLSHLSSKEDGTGVMAEYLSEGESGF